MASEWQKDKTTPAHVIVLENLVRINRTFRCRTGSTDLGSILTVLELARTQRRSMDISSIAESTKMSRASVMRRVQDGIDRGLLVVEKIGRRRIVLINYESPDWRHIQKVLESICK